MAKFIHSSLLLFNHFGLIHSIMVTLIHSIIVLLSLSFPARVASLFVLVFRLHSQVYLGRPRCLFVLVNLVLHVGVVHGPMHQQILGCIVQQHDNPSPKAWLNFVEFQVGEQVVGESKENSADRHEPIWIGSSPFISVDGENIHHQESEAIRHKEGPIRKIIPQRVHIEAKETN